MTALNPNPYLPMDAPLLRQRIEEVDLQQIGTAQLEELIERMEAIARAERQQKRMVGLAASQIGINKAIILVDLHMTEARNEEAFEHDLALFINPKIIWYSPDCVEGIEGCFSAFNLRGMVNRSQSVQIEALLRDGTKISRVFTGFTARIIQHEIDHLHGLRFPDRMLYHRKLHWVTPEECDRYFKEQESWPHSCSKEEWQALVGIEKS